MYMYIDILLDKRLYLNVACWVSANAPVFQYCYWRCCCCCCSFISSFVDSFIMRPYTKTYIHIEASNLSLVRLWIWPCLPTMNVFVCACVFVHRLVRTYFCLCCFFAIHSVCAVFYIIKPSDISIYTFNAWIFPLLLKLNLFLLLQKYLKLLSRFHLIISLVLNRTVFFFFHSL